MARPLPDALLALPHRREVPFARLTTLGVGGVCRWLFEPVTEAQAQAFVRACAREGLPWRVLGGGSNLVVLGDVAEPVLRLRLPAALVRQWCRRGCGESRDICLRSSPAMKVSKNAPQRGWPPSAEGAVIAWAQQASPVSAR